MNCIQNETKLQCVIISKSGKKAVSMQVLTLLISSMPLLMITHCRQNAWDKNQHSHFLKIAVMLKTDNYFDRLVPSNLIEFMNKYVYFSIIVYAACAALLLFPALA